MGLFLPGQANIPAFADVDESPTAIALTNVVVSLSEDADTSGATKMGEIVITDDALGTNVVSLSGADAALFDVEGGELFLQAGVVLDYETRPGYAVTLGTGVVSVDHTLGIVDVDESPTAIALTNTVSILADDLRFWVEKVGGNSVVYFQTGVDVSLTAIKLYFDNLFSHSADLQFRESTVINALGPHAWTVVENVSQKSVFLYGTTAQAIASSNSTGKFYVVAGDLDLVGVSDMSDENAEAVGVDRVSLTGPVARVVVSLEENIDTSSGIRMGYIQVADDALGANEVTLSGDDAASFEIVGNELRLKEGVALDYEAQSSYSVTLATGSVSVEHTLGIVDVDESPAAIALVGAVLNLLESTDTAGAIKIGDIEITDDALGTNEVTLSGDDAALFEVVGSELFLKAGVVLDYETQSSYAVTLGTGSVSVSHTLNVSIDTDGDGIGNDVDRDDDGDGFSDMLEVRFDGDPLDPGDRDNIESFIINEMDAAEGTIQELQARVAALSLRPTLEEIRDGRPGSVLLTVDSEAGSVVLNFTVEESEDLITWTPVEGSGVSQTLTLPEGKRFYRFAH